MKLIIIDQLMVFGKFYTEGFHCDVELMLSTLSRKLANSRYFTVKPKLSG